MTELIQDRQTTTYVVGFLFHEDVVALITKARPAWQRGLLNGVGGHVEPEESIHTAMMREFEEETRVVISDWQHFATLRFGFPDDLVYFFRSHAKMRHTFTSLAGEPVEWYPIQSLLFRPDINPHLKYLIPLALQTDEVTMRKKQFFNTKHE